MRYFFGGGRGAEGLRSARGARRTALGDPKRRWRVAVEAFCRPASLERFEDAIDASCSFISSALRRRRRRRTRGVLPFKCVIPRVCARVFVCVWNKRGEQEGERERERKSERERYERKTDRTPGGEKTGAFGLVLETEAFRLHTLQKENFKKK